MSLPATVSEWEHLRHAARLRVQEARARRHPDLRLDAIDRAAVGATTSWSGRRRPFWNWQTIAASYSRARIEVAIWSGERLCGLAIGGVGPDHVGLDRIEADPDPLHALKGDVFDLAALCAEATAMGIGARQVRINGPTASLRDWYAARGYSTIVRRGYEIDYLYKRMPVIP